MVVFLAFLAERCLLVAGISCFGYKDVCSKVESLLRKGHFPDSLEGTVRAAKQLLEEGTRNKGVRDFLSLLEPWANSVKGHDLVEERVDCAPANAERIMQLYGLVSECCSSNSGLVDTSRRPIGDVIHLKHQFYHICGHEVALQMSTLLTNSPWSDTLKLMGIFRHWRRGDSWAAAWDSVLEQTIGYCQHDPVLMELEYKGLIPRQRISVTRLKMEEQVLRTVYQRLTGTCALVEQSPELRQLMERAVALMQLTGPIERASEKYALMKFGTYYLDCKEASKVSAQQVVEALSSGQQLSG